MIFKLLFTGLPTFPTPSKTLCKIKVHTVLKSKATLMLGEDNGVGPNALRARPFLPQVPLTAGAMRMALRTP